MNKEISEQGKQKMGYYNTFYISNPILMKLGEVVVHMGTTTSPSFIKIRLKMKKFL